VPGASGPLKPFPSIHAFILGGGKSLRANRDKALLRSRGRYFIDIVIECAASLFGAVTLVGRQYEHAKLDGQYPDDVEGVGPLGGILTALRKTDRNLNFFTAIDYPFIDPEVVSYLARQALEWEPRGDGLIPVMPDGPHPLFAFYARSCLQAVERCIAREHLRVQCISQGARILYLDIASAGSGLSMERFERNFVNINRYEDYLSHIREERSGVDSTKKNL
jgi:molybdopterin-guanine dinucleotide biosynthesis protein A